jgi:ATP-binding cassette subfamily B protein
VYARRHRLTLTLTLGVLAAVLTRLARPVRPVVAAATDRAIRGAADAGLRTDLGVLPPGRVTGEAARLALLERLVVAVLAYLVRSTARLAPRYLFQATARRIQHDLRNEIYDHLRRLSMDRFADHRTAG